MDRQSPQQVFAALVGQVAGATTPSKCHLLAAQLSDVAADLEGQQGGKALSLEALDLRRLVLLSMDAMGDDHSTGRLEYAGHSWLVELLEPDCYVHLTVDGRELGIYRREAEMLPGLTSQLAPYDCANSWLQDELEHAIRVLLERREAAMEAAA